MNIAELSQESAKLLTLPHSDLQPANTNDILLMQMPPGWSINDWKDAYFVAKPGDQAAVVIESKKASFAVHRVETSNALITIPPQQPERICSKTSEEDSSCTGPASKKIKSSAPISSAKKLLSNSCLQARLVKPGGSGASFLELRRTFLTVGNLQDAIASQVWNPYLPEVASMTVSNPYQQAKFRSEGATPAGLSAKDRIGKTVAQLAGELQVSKTQIRGGLTELQAYCMDRKIRDEIYRNSPSNYGGVDNSSDVVSERYCLLAEEPLLAAFQAILSALAEVDDCQDYARRQGLDVHILLTEAMQRMSTEERFPDVENVLLHCLETFAAKAGTQLSGHETNLRLDATKVAICVARRIFQKQTSPWEEALFLSRWQSEVPGVGSSYQVHTDMLRGVAVPVCGSSDGIEDDGVFWKYLPAEMLPSDPKACFQELFAQKKRWTLQELEPYLDRLTGEHSPAAQVDLLLQFSTTSSEEVAGIQMKYYLSR